MSNQVSNSHESMQAATRLKDEKPSRQRFLLLAILFITLFVAYVDRVNISVIVASDAFLNDMGIKGQPVQIGLLMSSFLIAYGFSNVFLSAIGDYWGQRKSICAAVIIWILSMFIGGIAPTFAIMLISRVLLGIGEGIHFPLQSTYVKRWFPPQERGKANACWSIGSSFAPAIAMPFFAWLVAHYAWHTSFLFCMFLGLIPLYLLWFYTADTPQEHKKVNSLELQHIEQGLAKEFRLQTDGEDPVESLWTRIKLVAGDYRIWLVTIISSMNNCIYWGLITWLPTYLKSARGFSWTEMGVLSSMPFVLGILCKVFAGWASDRVGKRAPFCVIGGLGAAIGIYFGAVVSNNYVAALFICMGLGLQIMSVPLSFSMLQQFLPDRVISLGTGISSGIGIGISALVPALIGLVISITGGFSGALYLLVGMALIGMLSALVLAWKKY